MGYEQSTDPVLKYFMKMQELLLRAFIKKAVDKDHDGEDRPR